MSTAFSRSRRVGASNTHTQKRKSSPPSVRSEGMGAEVFFIMPSTRLLKIYFLQRAPAVTHSEPETSDVFAPLIFKRTLQPPSTRIRKLKKKNYTNELFSVIRLSRARITYAVDPQIRTTSYGKLLFYRAVVMRGGGVCKWRECIPQTAVTFSPRIVSYLDLLSIRGRKDLRSR